MEIRTTKRGREYMQTEVYRVIAKPESITLVIVREKWPGGLRRFNDPAGMIWYRFTKCRNDKEFNALATKVFAS